MSLRFVIAVPPLEGEGLKDNQTSAPTAGPSRHVKSRTGCQQCKKKRVKCDEKQPTCSRCAAKSLTCTGNFQLDQWQIERPWFNKTYVHGTTPALENETIRHWYDKACLNMALFPPPLNPLSYGIAPLLRRSKALRHTIQCVSEGHRQHFSQPAVLEALRERGLALLSLQEELSKLSKTANPTRLLQIAALSSLILCISSGWLDMTGRDFGLDHLYGARDLISMLLKYDTNDSITLYLLGLLVYWEYIVSFLIPSTKHRKRDPRIMEALQDPKVSQSIHPVTGIYTGLCPLLTEIGHYYRFVVEHKNRVQTYDISLETKIRNFKLPHEACNDPLLGELAESFRSIGIIMLYQARAVVGELNEIDQWDSAETVLQAVHSMQHIAQGNTLLNWEGPLILIAGSELQSFYLEERAQVEACARQLASRTRVNIYQRGLEIVQDVWRLRDQGSTITWLELMLEKGLALPMG